MLVPHTGSRETGQRSGPQRNAHERRLTVPHILTTILTQVAVALLEAALIRLSLQLWKTFADSGRPVAAHA